MCANLTSYCPVCSQPFNGRICCRYNSKKTVGDCDAEFYGGQPYGVQPYSVQPYGVQSYGVQLPPQYQFCIASTTTRQVAINTSAADCEAIRRRIVSLRDFRKNTPCVFITYFCETCRKPFGYNHLDATGKSNKCFDLTDHKNTHHGGINVDFKIKCAIKNPCTGAIITEIEAKRDQDILNNVTLWERISQFF